MHKYYLLTLRRHIHKSNHTARSLLERTGADATYAIQKKIVVSDVLQGLSREEPKRFENARYEDMCVCGCLALSLSLVHESV